MPFADYARSIPRAYPEVPSKKTSLKKKFYSYHPPHYSNGIGRWEIVGNTLNRNGRVDCISHNPQWPFNPYILTREWLREIPE